MGKDYYKILGVDKSSSQDDIKKAFRKKAHELHPDKGGDPEKFKEVNEAYQVLGNPQKRAKYDQFGSAFEHAQAGGGFGGFEGFRDFSDFSDAFGFGAEDLGDIFGGLGSMFGFGKSRESKRGGRNIEAEISINFMEAVSGTEKEINLQKRAQCDRCGGKGAEPGAKVETCKICGGTGRVTRVQRTIFGAMQVQTTCSSCGGEGKVFSQKCSKCGGSGTVKEAVRLRVKIPAGIENGGVIRLSGQGEAGEKGAKAGDLYLRIRIIPDKRFERRGGDIFSTAYINFTQAALGDKIDVETVDGAVKMKIPEGTQSETEFRLRGKGMPHLQGRGKGDHIVKIKVRTPVSLNKKQKEAFKDLGI